MRAVIALRGAGRARSFIACLACALPFAVARGEVREPKSEAAPAPAPPTAAAPAALEDAESALGAVKFGIALPQEKFAQLEVHWAQRLGYLRDRDERRADDEEQHIAQLKDELAIDDLYSIAGALVRESDSALGAGARSLAHKRCNLAIQLAPDLAAAYLCSARASLSLSPSDLRDTMRSLLQGLSATLRDARTWSALRVDAGAIGLLGLALAGAAYALLLFLRYAKLYIHDVHHLFPRGARRWQTAMLACALVLSPLLLQLGPVPLLFTLLAAAALYASARELAVSALLLLLLALAPMAIESLASTVSYAGPAADLWMVERGEGSEAGLARLRHRAEQASPEFPVAFALARRAKREGDLTTAARLYQQAIEAPGTSSESLAAAHNNLGNVQLLMGDAQKARAEYAEAIELQDSLAAAHFNLGRALGLGGVESLEKVQAEQARALELDRPLVEAFTGGQLQVNRKANRFVMDVRLPEASLSSLRATDSARAQIVADAARARLNGTSRGELAPMLPILAALLLLLIHRARTLLRPSGRCEKCGREVCKRCDADARPSEALCAQCVNVFIRRSSVEPNERTRKEVAVARHRKRRMLLVRASSVVSGAAHVLMGRPLLGMLFLIPTGLLVASVLLGGGLIRAPFALHAGVSSLRAASTSALFLLVYGLCVRDLLARQRAES